MKKRVVALLMAAGMIVGMMSGCGQKESAPTSAESSTTSAGGSKVEVKEETQAEDEEEVVTVKWALRSDSQDDDEMVFEAMNELLRERYHLEIEPIIISPGEYNDRMKLMSTANEDYDLCFTSSWANTFSDNVSREAFLPLNDILASDAGTLLTSALPREYEEYCAVATVNGQIYAVPNYQLIYTQTGAYIQKDLADEYGLDADSIEDLTDLVPFMEWVRDNKDDVWPLCEISVSTAYPERDFGFAGLGVYDGDDRFCSSLVYVGRADETYTAKLIYENEYWNAAMKELNEYYKKGFFRSDYATVTDNSADKAANRYAIVLGIAKPGGEAEYTNNYGEEYIQIALGVPYLDITAGITTMTAVNVNSKNPEAAIKLLGVMWTDKEIFNMMLFGLEGEHYTKVNENRIELISDSGYNRTSLGWAIGNQFEAYVIPGQDDDVWEVTSELNGSAIATHMAGFVSDETSIETELAQINAVKSEYHKQGVYVDDYDAWLTEYVEKLKVAGLEKVLEVTQQNIDAWRAASGK